MTVEEVSTDDMRSASAPRSLVRQASSALEGEGVAGLTALGALSQKSAFKAGCSRSCIADLTALRTGPAPSKFEAKYLDRLVGSW